MPLGPDVRVLDSGIQGLSTIFSLMWLLRSVFSVQWLFVEDAEMMLLTLFSVQHAKCILTSLVQGSQKEDTVNWGIANRLGGVQTVKALAI